MKRLGLFAPTAAMLGTLVIGSVSLARAGSPPVAARRAAAVPEYVYDHVNPQRFSANPQTPLDPYYNYPPVNTPNRAYPYGWFGARNKPRDLYYRGTRGYPVHMHRWPGR